MALGITLFIDTSVHFITAAVDAPLKEADFALVLHISKEKPIAFASVEDCSDVCAVIFFFTTLSLICVSLNIRCFLEEMKRGRNSLTLGHGFVDVSCA